MGYARESLTRAQQNTQCTGHVAPPSPSAAFPDDSIFARRELRTFAQPGPGDILRQTFQFSSQIVQHAYFNDKTFLVRLADHSIWQSLNEGYTWDQKFPQELFLAFYHHKYASNRAYLITNTARFYVTTDSGRTWTLRTAPTPPNTFRARPNCRAEAQYSRDNGRHWSFVEHYVVNCAWAMDATLHVDHRQILCESYRDKTGSQRLFQRDNPLALVAGSAFFTKKKTLFENVVGFATFAEFLVVAELVLAKRSLQLQVSLDGIEFAPAKFPPDMHPEAHAYTILESGTPSLFLHILAPNPHWGNLLKSNSNGTYFGLSLANVHRDDRGFVDFEKVSGLEGIAFANVVADPRELQSRITHNDGATWTPLVPPQTDSLGNNYAGCASAGTRCALHIHGSAMRTDPRATYSTPAAVGLLLAVGNVGASLAPYAQGDTFLSRDGGRTWAEAHKGAHVWAVGDSGALVVLAGVGAPTDRVLYSTDEGLSWRVFRFAYDHEGREGEVRVQAIVTVPAGTSRRFILLGVRALRHNHTSGVAVNLDFTYLTARQCVISVEDPGHDDFELWSPSAGRHDQEECLFGRQTLYHRRVRTTDCVVGSQPKAPARIVKNCTCTRDDFEWSVSLPLVPTYRKAVFVLLLTEVSYSDFNYVKDTTDACVLTPGATPLPNEPSCQDGEDYWYERTPYRKISFSSCEGGAYLDQGARHPCPRPRAAGHGGSSVSWFSVIILCLMIPVAVALGAWRYYTHTGTIRLR
ncbi:hypothetical protein B0H14DRAFT_3517289 [Mycena olivaceomarginata]|nr:hypothetical protein B0H14DRAFT_3517289 [Mycena olivaceomarginata]